MTPTNPQREAPIEVQCPLHGGRAFLWGECSIIVNKWPQGWHLSIAHPTRYPTWDEIRDARYEFLDDNLYMAIILPPKNEYVNIHKNCYHLHEIPPG